jgi:Helix-turn-helix domain
LIKIAILQYLDHMPLETSKRLQGPERAKIAALLAKEYEAGASIRQLAAAHGTSIGRARNLLVEAGVSFRTRGGATRGRSSSSPKKGSRKSK